MFTPTPCERVFPPSAYADHDRAGRGSVRKLFGGLSMFGKLRALLLRFTAAPERIDLDVPFACKDEVKRLGAR